VSGTARDTTRDDRRHAILAIDTATTRVVIATGSPDGTVDGDETWVAGYRHGETLLPTIGRFLGEQGIERSRLVGIVVGTGPGAFTGLRVDMATAKGLAHGLGIPLVGVSTADALMSASGLDTPVLLMPAGPSDRVLIRSDVAPRLLPGGTEPDLADGETLVAVDLDGRAPDDALERGEAARDGLGQALLRLGAPRLADAVKSAAHLGELDTLVPEYVTLPRGAVQGGGEVSWSRDPR
jgi:tRNA threonylcarbamoyl adenosine modification protein YeaZ